MRCAGRGRRSTGVGAHWRADRAIAGVCLPAVAQAETISEIKANAGDASRYSTRHINRIIKQELGAKPRRRPQTGQPNALASPAQAPKTTRVVRAAEFSNQPYLETEAEVDAYLTRLKSELLAVVRAGQKARVQ